MWQIDYKVMHQHLDLKKLLTQFVNAEDTACAGLLGNSFQFNPHI